MEDIEQLSQSIDNAHNLNQLSNALDKVSKALDVSCKQLYKAIFDYKFSRYLYYHYIVLNKSYKQISEEIGIPPSTVYLHIVRYNLKKDPIERYKRTKQTMQQTCQQKYGVDCVGMLPSVHQKRIENILEKTNGQYNKQTYPKLKKSKQTRRKISQQKKALAKQKKQLKKNAARGGSNSG